MTTGDGTGVVIDMRRRAVEVPPPGREEDRGGGPPDDPPGGGGGASGGRGVELPEGCPVVPLGVYDDQHFYLDRLHQLRALKAKDHSRLNVQALFGDLTSLLYDFWPRQKLDEVTGQWIVTGWKPELAAEALMAAAAARGVWNPQEKVRGAGAWAGGDGELILHTGPKLLLVRPAKSGPARAVLKDPGLLDGMVYPTAPHTLTPAAKPDPAGDEASGQQLLAMLRTWAWRRKEVDPYLLLGWICAGYLGGALPWRAVAWITGGSGAGKSTLQDAIKWLFGENGLLHTPDGTAAAIRQTLRHASLPVALDEAEAEADNRKMQALIKLARDAATGSMAIRGGSDHQVSQFIVRSCFLFSSVLIPPLLPQDRNRMAILSLDPLPKDQKPPPITRKAMAELGGRLLRRLVDNWPRAMETLSAYRGAMAAAGHTARGQDVFGTMLACADLALHDDPPDAARLAVWEKAMAASVMVETESAVSDPNACLNHLLSTVQEQTHDRKRMTIGYWIGRAAGRFDHEIGEKGKVEANSVLQECGLKLVTENCRQYLAVANMHRGLTRIFENTQWAAQPGADGVWVQSLRRLEHIVPKKPYWFGVAARCTLLPVALCLPDGTAPKPADDPQPNPPPEPRPYDGCSDPDPLAEA